MAQIFVSHSAKNRRTVDFFSNAFASTKVRAVFEEFDAIGEGRRSAAQIQADIAHSNATFTVLGPEAEALRHTRDRIAWENGVSVGDGLTPGVANKDVWVFELWSDTARLSIVIPRLRHYVRFDINDDWLKYVRTIINSYDNSHVLPAIAAGAGAGALAGPEGAIIGGLGAFLLAVKATSDRPSGFPFVCPSCHSSYNLHLPNGFMRCPVCNCRFQVMQPQLAAGATS